MDSDVIWICKTRGRAGFSIYPLLRSDGWVFTMYILLSLCLDKCFGMCEPSGDLCLSVFDTHVLYRH